VIASLVRLLDIIRGYVRDIPPVENSKSRFGNPAFRDFYDRVCATAAELLKEFVPKDAIQEVEVYLTRSFGDWKRIDYGTGHEANFIAFLLCLYKLDVVAKTDMPALVIHVFYGYMDVMRDLQFHYWLEPAGSHGVWGLDDYHFLPFLFGASQLATHKHLKPKCIHDKEIVEEFAPDYMYLKCVQFINSVKTASLRWHSPMLDDISSAKSWNKIATGLIRMYDDHVLSKLPIMQHFLFGSLLAFQGASTEHDWEALQASGLDCVHALGKEVPGCCVIRMPSAIGATTTTKRILPFD
jgi:serine/threonine-protein phosphatase 2A activator